MGLGANLSLKLFNLRLNLHYFYKFLHIKVYQCIVIVFQNIVIVIKYL